MTEDAGNPGLLFPNYFGISSFQHILQQQTLKDIFL